jgi:hypothetical protein
MYKGIAFIDLLLQHACMKQHFLTKGITGSSNSSSSDIKYILLWIQHAIYYSIGSKLVYLFFIIMQENILVKWARAHKPY